MFWGCYKFNGDISNWETKSLVELERLFMSAVVFDQPLYWDVSKVTNMYGVFWNARKFNGDISGWDVSGVTNM